MNKARAQIIVSWPLPVQIDLLVAGLCPGAEDPAECEAGLPDFWRAIAALLWPGYWDSKISS